jgi:hypothetical protein
MEERIYCSALLAEIALIAEELAGETLCELRHRRSALCDQLRERESNAMPVQREVGDQPQAFAGKLADHRQHAKPALIKRSRGDLKRWSVGALATSADLTGLPPFAAVSLA